MRLARLGDQQQDVLIARLCRKGGQMATGQIPIPLHTGVFHATVHARANPQATRPVQRRERRLEAGQVRLLHVDETPLDQLCATPARVANSHPASEYPAA